VAVLVFDIVLQFDTNFFYREDPAELGSLGGLNISITTFALAALYVGWLVDVLAAKSTPQTLRFSWSLFTYVALVLLSVMVARDHELAIFELALLVQMALVFFFIANFVRTPADAVFLVRLLLVSLALESALMVAAYAGLALTLPGLSSQQQSGIFTRVGGTLGSPNNAAAYLMVALALVMGVLLTGARGRLRLLALVSGGLGGAALLVTFSRGGWLGFVVATTVLLICAWRRGRLRAGLPLKLMTGTLLVALFFGQTIRERIFGDDRGAAYSRIPLMKLALRVIADNPVLGVGANNLPIRFDDYAGHEMSGEWLYAVHNQYLLVWAEQGTLGLLAYLTFLLGTLRNAWRCWRGSHPMLSPLALGLLAGLIGFMVHMAVDVFRDRPLLQLLCVVSGLTTAILPMTVAEAGRRNASPSSTLSLQRAPGKSSPQYS
jgi:O-antigen ligase